MSASAIWWLDDGGATLGGGQLVALRLARHAGRPVRLVCPPGSPLWEAAADLDRVAAEFPAPVVAKAGRLAMAARALRGVLAPARAGEAIVVSGTIRASLIAAPALAARRAAPPLVHLMLERDSAQRASVRIALRRSRRVVAVGDVAAQAYRAALPAARVVKANNFLTPDALAGFLAVRRSSPPAMPPVLGVVARLIPEKGVDALVGELAADPGAWSRLLVAGARQDETHAAAIEARVADAGLDGRVPLLGQVPDLAGFLAQLDALVVPSTGNEGQPTVILEALAAGLPVIARAPMVSSDFTALPVIPYTTPAELSTALRALPLAPADPDVLTQRFGIDQILAAIDEAAG